MNNFSYNAAPFMDKEVVMKHIAAASPASVSAALANHKRKGNTAVVALIEEGRLRARIARLEAKRDAMNPKEEGEQA